MNSDFLKVRRTGAAALVMLCAAGGAASAATIPGHSGTAAAHGASRAKAHRHAVHQTIRGREESAVPEVEGPGSTGVNSVLTIAERAGASLTGALGFAAANSTPAVAHRAARSNSLLSGNPLSSVSVPVNSIYWGAVTGTQFTGDLAPWDWQPITDFEQQDAAGKQMSIVPMYENFADCSTSPCEGESFPWTPFTTIRTAGAIPMVSWSSQTLQDGLSGATTDAQYTDAAVAAGHFDSYITEWAQTAKAWGHPFFMRFDWEMNGNWFPWDMNTNGNSPADYVAMWRHVHDIFTKVGATNATWVWCPNVNQDDTYANLAALYPGDSYVDWTCMDGYNWGTEWGGSWESFDQVFSSTYQQITQQIAPSKPVMLGEFNSNSDGGSQGEWLTDALARIPLEYPAIHAAVLFDSDPFAIESSLGSRLGFAAGINTLAYTENEYASLGGSSPSAVPTP